MKKVGNTLHFVKSERPKRARPPACALEQEEVLQPNSYTAWFSIRILFFFVLKKCLFIYFERQTEREREREIASRGGVERKGEHPKQDAGCQRTA